MAKRIIGLVLLVWGGGGFIANIIGMVMGIDAIALIPSTIISIIFVFVGYRLAEISLHGRSRDSGQAW